MLNKSNYFERTDLMSASQYLAFQRCEAAGLAEFLGQYKRESTAAMIQGSYIDAHVEGTSDEFREAHPELISSRGPTAGQLKAEYRHLDNIIRRFERDPVFMSYLEGEKQVILTGTIGGIKWKGKLDVLHPARIVDMKTAKDFAPIWSADEARRMPIAEYWGWLEQAAIYQELVHQTFGDTRPVYLAVVTKESEPDLAVLSIPDETLKTKLEEIAHFSQRYAALKCGDGEPERCEKCDWCKSTKVLTGPVDYLEVGA